MISRKIEIFTKECDNLKKRHNVESNIKKFYKMVKAGQVVFDCPIQRDDKQWSLSQKSKLIRAILVDFSIPPIYSVGLKNEENNEMIYSILDGKQRLTTLIEFLDGEFPISPKMEEIEFEGKIYNIKGMRFQTMPIELKEAIYDYSLNMVYYVHLSDSEIAEMFDLLNNGTPLSRQQKANAHMGMDAARKMNELKKHQFFLVNAALSKNQHTKSEDIEAITQAMMILDKDYALESFSGKNMNQYSATIKYGKDHLFSEIKGILDYIHDALDFYTDKLVLKKTVIPIVIQIGQMAKNDDMPKDMFLEWIQQFKLSIENKGKIKINYHEYMGTGSFSKNKLHGRLNAAKRHYNVFKENALLTITE